MRGWLAALGAGLSIALMGFVPTWIFATATRGDFGGHPFAAQVLSFLVGLGLMIITEKFGIEADQAKAAKSDK